MMNLYENSEQIIASLDAGSYPILGVGSGRRVYDLGNGTVIKIARNIKGHAQNEMEQMISEMEESNIFAKVLGVFHNSHYLVMEKADPIFRISAVRSYYGVRNNRELFQLNNLSYILRKYNLLTVDLCRPANWGVIEGRPVIIDYGFTGRIRRKYY